MCPVENRATTTLFFQRHLTVEVKKCIHLLSIKVEAEISETDNKTTTNNCMLCLHKEIINMYYFQDVLIMASCIVFNCNYKAFAYLIPNSDLIHHLHLTVIRSYRATHRHMTSSSCIIQTTLFKEGIKKMFSVIPDCSPELLNQS